MTMMRIEATDPKTGKREHLDFDSSLLDSAELIAARAENTALRKFFADNDIPLPQGVSK